MPSAVLVAAGLVALLVGAEVLIRGGTGLAAWLGVTPMVIGLTVVSLGTSLPELAVGIDAARRGSPDLAVGNIVGTNLVNVLFILGLSALLVPVLFERRTLVFDLPAMTAAAVLLYVLSLDGSLSTLDGLLLVAGAAAYTWQLLRLSRREPPVDDEADLPTERRPLRDSALLLIGLTIILLGADLLVDGSVRIAESFGVSEAMIGLTVVAIGTSAPELVTTILSTIRGDRDIAIGNLLGSSIYNIAFVLGLTIVVAPGSVTVADEVLATDLLLLVLTALVAVPIFVSGARITRLEGGLLTATYVGYLGWLLLTRT